MAHSIVSPVLIGRRREIDRLQETTRLAAGGEGRLVLISGEPGMGKSRLLEEIAPRPEENWVLLRGHCYEQEISFPYSPWIDVLRRFLARRTPAEFHHLPEVISAPLVQLLPELQSQVPSSEQHTPLDPQDEKRLLYNAVLTWIVQEARAQPVLLEIEDIHWSDEASLDLLLFIVRHIPDTPVAVLATYRSDEVRPGLAAFLAEIDRERRAEEIRLAPLTRPEVEQMAAVLLGLPPGSSPNLLEPVFAWMEGNPFFIEEILQALVEGGHRPGGGWMDLEQLHIPRSVQEALRRRAMGLSAPALKLLTLAAATGQQFEGRLLEALAQVDEGEFLPLIHELMEAQFIMEIPGEASGEDRFAFRHALTREAIYSTLLGREKQNLHHRIGKTLELAAGAGSPRHLAELAYHFYEAASWPEAFDYTRLAGERAESLYAPREAALHYSHAMDAARHLGRTPPISCLAGRAHAYELLGDFDRARQDYETALGLARENKSQTLECRLLIQLGFLWHARDFRRSGEYFQQALEFAQQQPDPALLGHTLNRVGNWQMNQNQPFAARTYHEQALAIFERLEDEQGIGESLDLLGITHYLCGNMLQGEACFERAIQLWEQLGNRHNLIQSLVHVTFPAVVDTEVERPIDPAAQRAYGETALHMAGEMGWRSAEVDALATLASLSAAGEYDRSLEDSLSGLEIARDIDHHFSLALFYSHFGAYYLDLFDLPAARQALDQALHIARSSGAELLVRRSMALLAAVQIQAGELSQASRLLSEAIPEWQPRQSVFVRQAWRVRAELALAQGHPAEALRIVDALIEQAENGPARGERAVPALARLRGEALAKLQRWTEAEAELQTAVALAGEHNRLPLLWRAQVSLGRFYLARKQVTQAAAAFESARKLVERLGGEVPPALRQHFLETALAQIPKTGRQDQRALQKRRPGSLTGREQEVAILIGRGKSNREIADELVVGVRTVEAHITRILAKLNFSSRTEVALWAVANGLVSTPSKTEK